jgi:tetratricopeptide (TPR) repeat protein
MILVARTTTAKMTVDNDNISKLYNTAVQHAKAGALTQADVLLNQILSQEPSHLKSLDLMGFVQYFLKKPEKAITYCEAALTIKPDHAYALKGLGLSLAACGRVDEGEGFIRQAISISPSYFDAYWDLAVTLARAGRTEDALEQVDASIQTFPDKRKRLMFLKSKIENGLAG